MELLYAAVAGPCQTQQPGERLSAKDTVGLAWASAAGLAHCEIFRSYSLLERKCEAWSYYVGVSKKKKDERLGHMYSIVHEFRLKHVGSRRHCLWELNQKCDYEWKAETGNTNIHCQSLLRRLKELRAHRPLLPLALHPTNNPTHGGRKESHSVLYSTPAQSHPTESFFYGPCHSPPLRPTTTTQLP